jgi:DNA-binding CsgD family transcriptional regulator
MHDRPATIRWLGAHAERVLAARGCPERVAAVLAESAVPMALLDDERRIVDANVHHAAAVGMSQDELRNLRIDDFTPPVLKPDLEQGWRRMLETGIVTSNDFSALARDYLGITNYSVANVLPGRHVISFVPAGWPLDGQPPEHDITQPPPSPSLTCRELEVLALAANGLNGPAIAEALVLSLATVRTHFSNIYRKLDVGDRAAAVAKAMRLGLFS